MGYSCNLIQSAVYWFADQAFISTASGIYLTRHGLDFGITRTAGTKATGVIAFSRLSSTGSVTIASGTQLVTDPSLYDSLVYVTTQTATINSGFLNTTATIEAFEAGSKYNVLPDSVRFFVTPIAGVDDITNASAITGGLDETTDSVLKTNILEGIQNLARATVSALRYASNLVSGVDSVYVKSRPDEEVIYQQDDPDAVLYGTWSTIFSNDYYYGTGIETSTPNDYITFTFQNEESITPDFIGQASESIVEIYIDNVSQGQMNIETLLTTFEGLTYTCTTAKHVLKIKLISGTLALDCFKCYNSAKRDATIKVYIDDGSGTSSWTLLKAVEDSLEDYRACGIRTFVVRCEVYTLDMDVSILWNTSVDKTTTKTQIEADLSDYFASLQSGDIVYRNNLYGFFNYQTISGRHQIVNTTINLPIADLDLDPDTVVRLGTITYHDVTS